jgi:hypothetical protein
MELYSILMYSRESRRRDSRNCHVLEQGLAKPIASRLWVIQLDHLALAKDPQLELTPSD